MKGDTRILDLFLLFRMSKEEIMGLINEKQPVVFVSGEHAYTVSYPHLDSNPRNRKTARGIKRVITGWLSRAQDKAPAYRPHPGGKRNIGTEQYMDCLLYTSVSEYADNPAFQSDIPEDDFSGEYQEPVHDGVAPDESAGSDLAQEENGLFCNDCGAEINERVYAVSYTHLDVYKRQIHDC